MAALYDVYFIIGQNAYTDRIQRPETGDIAVTIEFQGVRSNNWDICDFFTNKKITTYKAKMSNDFISLPEQSSESTGLLIIYAYDLQLSEYMTYNVSIKPNTYRSDYSTVDNGFGCFGSLNVFSKMINF